MPGKTAVPSVGGNEGDLVTTYSTRRALQSFAIEEFVKRANIAVWLSYGITKAVAICVLCRFIKESSAGISP